METREFRIGNTIIDYYGVINTISSILEDGTIMFYNDDRCHISKCNPIELTEELLLKYGFVAESVHNNFIKNGIEISSSQKSCNTNERFIFYLDGEIPDSFKIRIEFIHQLQNIVFALTGQELDVSQIINA